MCYEFQFGGVDERIRTHFGLVSAQPPPLNPEQPNLYPDMLVPVIGRKAGHVNRGLVAARWGLVPSDAPSPEHGQRPANARSETVHRLPMFRDSFRQRRCLIPGDAFFEWSAARPKKRYRCWLRDGSPIGFAAIWDRWTDGERTIFSCAMLTGEPNDLVGAFHPRMPVILAPADYDAWLDPGSTEAQLRTLLRPYPSELMEVAEAPRPQRVKPTPKE